MKLTTLIFSFLFLTIAFPEEAQRKTAKSDRTEKFATSPIDPAIMQLPPQYRGVDPELLFNELERRSKESKGEFETTAAFKTRMTNLESSPLIGTVTKDSLIALALASNTTILSTVTSRYDADGGALTVAIEMSSPIVGVQVDSSKRSVPLRYDFRPSTSYVGQNAYGAKVTIEKTFADIFELIVENFSSFQTAQSDPGFSLRSVITAKLEMTPVEAMAAKPNLRVLALVRLREPFLLKGYLSHKPTVSKPRDTLAVYQHIVGQVEEFWIYDYPTGRLYAKWLPR